MRKLTANCPQLTAAVDPTVVRNVYRILAIGRQLSAASSSAIAGGSR